MVTRKKIAFGIVHLSLVALGAAQVDLERLGRVGQVLAAYGSLSGSTTGYSFFAPGVGSPMRAQFDVTGSDGRTVTETLAAGDRESALRLGNIIEAARDRMEEKATRRALAASWAGHVLARHPFARSVKVRLEEYDLPTMTDSRRGASEGWVPIYSATFRR